MGSSIERRPENSIISAITTSEKNVGVGFLFGRRVLVVKEEKDNKLFWAVKEVCFFKKIFSYISGEAKEVKKILGQELESCKLDELKKFEKVESATKFIIGNKANKITNYFLFIFNKEVKYNIIENESYYINKLNNILKKNKNNDDFFKDPIILVNLLVALDKVIFSANDSGKKIWIGKLYDKIPEKIDYTSLPFSDAKVAENLFMTLRGVMRADREKVWIDKLYNIIPENIDYTNPPFSDAKVVCKFLQMLNRALPNLDNTNKKEIIPRINNIILSMPENLYNNNPSLPVFMLENIFELLNTAIDHNESEERNRLIEKLKDIVPKEGQMKLTSRGAENLLTVLKNSIKYVKDGSELKTFLINTKNSESILKSAEPRLSIKIDTEK